MNREKKLKLNTMVALINQLITIICGFVLPRFYLKCYGSSIYGLVSSITQFLSFVTLMELGMGAVVQSALYKPLAQKNKEEISKIISSAKKFFNKIAVVFLLYTILLSVIYPLGIQKQFGVVFEASLIIIISISSLAEYFFGITYKLLLTADQLAYIPLGLQSLGLVLNFIICIVLMRLGASIHTVKLVSSLVLLLRPVIQVLYVNKKYDIEKHIQYKEEPIKQKWNGIAQHIAYYVTNNTDTIVLSLFSTLENVSIYAIYNMITSGIKAFIMTLNSGVQALLGNLLANGENEELQKRFGKFEWEIHTVVTLLFSCVGILILPFVKIYTAGIDDADYLQPMFAVLLTMAQAAYCLRLPYNTMVCAAGHYKQTQRSAIIEMVLNLSITIILVFKFGLIGVAAGTLIALVYRTIYLALYISHSIVSYPIKNFIKNIFIDFVEVGLICIVTSWLPKECTSFLQWTVLAIEVFGISVIIVVIVNIITYKKHMQLFM